MLAADASEIHAYPLRPEGFEEPLFPTADSKRAIMEHLLTAPWISRISELEGRTGGAAGKEREIFEWMEGFSAAHTTSFAYLRCHYPAEFFCGVLNSRPMGFYSPRVLLNEVRRIGIGVLLPAVHLSGKDFTVEENGSALRDSGVTPSEKIKELPHGTRAPGAGLLECLQCPPTKSGTPVWFLLIEDEWGLLQATIFRNVYERYGDLLHHRGAFLLEGRVENTPEKGFSFVVQRIEDLRDVLSGAGVPSPKTVPASGVFLRAGSRGRRAG